MLNAEVMPSETPMDKMDFFVPLPLAADAEKTGAMKTTTSWCG